MVYRLEGLTAVVRVLNIAVANDRFDIELSGSSLGKLLIYIKGPLGPSCRLFEASLRLSVCLSPSPLGARSLVH